MSTPTLAFPRALTGRTGSALSSRASFTASETGRISARTCTSGHAGPHERSPERRLGPRGRSRQLRRARSRTAHRSPPLLLGTLHRLARPRGLRLRSGGRRPRALAGRRADRAPLVGSLPVPARLRGVRRERKARLLVLDADVPSSRERRRRRRELAPLVRAAPPLVRHASRSRVARPDPRLLGRHLDP